MQSQQIEGFRLSPQQRCLWRRQQAYSAHPYRVQAAILMAGMPNVMALKQALHIVVGQHEILRTTFQLLPGMTAPLQVIQGAESFWLCEYDLTDLSAADQELEIARLFEQVKGQPFSLADKPPLAVHLLALTASSHMLFLSLSALIADSTTLSQIVSQLSQLYTHGQQADDQQADGRQADGRQADGRQAETLADSDMMQYADVAEWQNELLEADESASDQAYWQRQMTRLGDPLNLDFLKSQSEAVSKSATDSGSSNSGSSNSGSSNSGPISSGPISSGPSVTSVVFEASLLDEINALGRQLGVSLSDILLAGWQMLLWRITGRQTLTIRVASDGRRYKELVQTLGLLSKYLPISFDLESTCSFAQVLTQTREQVSDACEWHDTFVPGGADAAGSPEGLSSIGFECSVWPECCSELGVSLTLERFYVRTEPLELNLVCWRQGDRLTADFYYDAHCYNAQAIAALSHHYITLLQAAVHSPQSAIGQLNLLSDRHRQFLLTDLNQTEKHYPPAQSIHALFESQIVQTPEHLAVVFEDESLTYAELNRQANQLAHHLQGLGVGAETVVGIYLERSHGLIVSLLAVLKAGGAYLPLDPATPVESLAFRLQDAQAPVVISQTHLAEPFGDAIGCHVICLDSQWHEIAQLSPNTPIHSTKPEDLAYILFTSGSTGQPKGVAVEHQHLLHYVRAIADRLDLNSCQSFATVSTFAADLGNTVIFPALVSGGCLHVISAARAANPDALADYFSRHPIDCLKIVPSHLSALLTAAHPEQILPRQRLVLGGEACARSLVQQIQDYKTECLIFNHYGPTETTVGVLTHPIGTDADVAGLEHALKPDTVPLGRPLANTQVYLLDADQQPLPLGVPGEICIGGAGVARGYLNRPDLTAARFIANPFLSDSSLSDSSLSTGDTDGTSHSSVPRLYRTGDLGRYQLDGTLEFLGRIDQQVKIRGYRIELGEIEVALQQHPDVKTAAVLVYEAQSGNQRLAAYIVPNKQADLQPNELRQWLQQKLPDYMVPAAFVPLKTLPLTPNGKLDRRALPDPATARPDRAETFVAPETETEKALAQIWAQTLKLDKIGVHDNFFELGGDSILSIQIVARANQAGLYLTPKQVFENQTVAELAAVATARQMVQAQQDLVLGDVPLTPIQHWFFQQALPEAHHWNQSILLEVQQPLDLAQLESVLQKLLEHHDALRLRFMQTATGWQAFGSELESTFPLTLIDLSNVAATEQADAITAAATALQVRLNLTEGPLIRVAYFKLGDNSPDRLLLIIHHLVVDGVSWRILLEDLQLLNQQLSQGQPLHLPPKTTSFQYWAKQLTAYAQSASLQSEVAYWQQQLQQPVVPIPVDFPEGDNTVATARVVSATLSDTETQALLQDVPATYHTQINDALLTALVQAFANWTGEGVLLVDLEGHGREDLFENVDISRTVGWFTTIFPIRLDIDVAPDPGTALKRIKEQLRSIPNRGIGYGLLRYLNPTQATFGSMLPVPVRFNYLGQTDQTLQSSTLFAPAAESRGLGRSPNGTRTYGLDIVAVVSGSQLRVDWSYSQDMYRAETIEALATGYVEALRSLITHCQAPDAGGYTPSDFSEANLNQQELDQFLSKITGKSS